MKLSELATQTSARVEGNSGNLEITGAAGLDEAEAGQITFLANPRYTPRMQTTRASAIYLAEDVETANLKLAVLRTRDPYLAYTRALRLFHPEHDFEAFIHPSAFVDKGAQIGAGVFIGASSVIGANTEIGDGVLIHPNVTIYEGVRIGKGSVIHSGVAIRERTEIGERVIVHNNAIIGSDGFGYAKDEDGHWLKIPQTGRVVVEDDVEIGAGTAIDRASVGETRIHAGAKIDNLVQVGHSCTVGEDTLLCGQVGLAGSTRVGKRVILAGQVGVAGHLSIGDDVVVTSQSGVPNSIDAGKVMSGSPAIENRDWLKASAAFRRLSDMQRKIRELEKRIEELSERKNAGDPGS